MAKGSHLEQLLYHPEHGWARLDHELATLGISWFAQDALGEVVFFDPPQVGSEVVAGEPYGEVESLKAISELIAPLSGEVVEVNDALAADAKLINAEPYGAGWLIKIRLSDSGETDLLLGANAYEATIA